VAPDLEQLGFVPDFTRSHSELYTNLFGGSWNSDNGAGLTVDGQAMIDTANWQRQFYNEFGVQAVAECVSSLDRYGSSQHPVYGEKRLSCQQCHRNPPSKSERMPDRGLYDGKVAMMVAGEWQPSSNYVARFQPDLDYGVAPFPLPADRPAGASRTLVEGPVALIPAG
jgi:ABC-type glycerol-3-phosphate transport system substrate-binding protein